MSRNLLKLNIALNNLKERHKAELDMFMCGQGFMVEFDNGLRKRVDPLLVTIDADGTPHLTAEDLRDLQVEAIDELPELAGLELEEG